MISKFKLCQTSQELLTDLAFHICICRHAGSFLNMVGPNLIGGDFIMSISICNSDEALKKSNHFSLTQQLIISLSGHLITTWPDKMGWIGDPICQFSG